MLELRGSGRHHPYRFRGRGDESEAGARPRCLPCVRAGAGRGWLQVEALPCGRRGGSEWRRTRWIRVRFGGESSEDPNLTNSKLRTLMVTGSRGSQFSKRVSRASAWAAAKASGSLVREGVARRGSEGGVQPDVVGRTNSYGIERDPSRFLVSWRHLSSVENISCPLKTQPARIGSAGISSNRYHRTGGATRIAWNVRPRIGSRRIFD